MIFSGVEDGSGKAVRLHANFSSELHMRTTDQVAGKNQELKKSPTKLLLQSFLFSNLTQLNNVRALLEQTVGGHMQQLFDLVKLFRLDSVCHSFWPLALVFTGTSSMAVTQWKVPTRRFPCGLQMTSWSATRAVPSAGSTKPLWVLQQCSHWLKTSELLPQISFLPVA